MNRPVAVILAVSMVAGCAEKKPAPEPTPPPPATPAVIDINATDYAFQAPDTIQGGWVTLRLHNAGRELHHAGLARLEQGKTIKDLATMGEAIPEWLVMAGGPNPAPPGGAVEATINLPPGSYVILCSIPSPDGKLHVMKGMVHPLTVTAATVEAQPAAADITIKLSDYDFAITPQLTAGKHIFRVENLPGQPHELVFVRVPAGKKAEDLLGWVNKMVGPPPIEGVVGGTTPLAAGGIAVFPGELAPGDYVLICFIPDPKDGKPHAAHGMMKTIKVA